MGKKLISMLLVLAIGITLLSGVAVLTSATETTVPEGATTMSAWATGNYADVNPKVLTINDEEDFKQFQTALCTYGKTFEGYTIYLTADIDMNPNWNSIVSLTWDESGALKDAVQQSTGTGDGYVLPAVNTTTNAAKAKQFGGVFDGMGHSISGLYTSQNSSNAVSLFGKAIGTAEVKNLAVLDSYFSCGKELVGTDRPVAGLFTVIPTGATAKISNCYVDIDIYQATTVKTAASSSYTPAHMEGQVGGLVGYCQGTLTVQDSVYAGSMSYNMNVTTYRIDNAGGIVGLVQGTTEAPANVTVSNYVFTGKIYSPYRNISGGIGRSKGYANITMTNCLCLGKQGGTNYAEGLISSVLVQGDSAKVKQNVTLTDCYYNADGSTRLIKLATTTTNTSLSSVIVTQNGVETYKVVEDVAANNSALNNAAYQIATEDYTGLTAKAALESKAIGGDTGHLSDVFTATMGVVAPKALCELFGPDAPVISTNPVGAAYDKEVGAAALTVEATGEGTLSYQWYCGGEAIEGATEATYTPATTTSGNYAYTCEVIATRTGFLGITAAAVSKAATVHVHDWTPGTCTSPKTCNVPECPTVVDAVDHAFDDDCTTADKCANCDEVAEANEKHTFDADCTTADKCANCETKATANEAHTYTDDHDTDCNTDGCTATREAIHTEGNVWSSDNTGHWHVCTGCEHTFPAAAHTDSETDEDILCDVCGYDMSCNHAERTKIDGTAATCTQDGKTTHWKCNKCGVLLDAEVDGNVITATATVIPAWHTDVSKKYSSDDTNHWKVCGACKAKLYVAAHTYSSATDTKCDCGHKRELVSLDTVITVTQWVKDGKSADVKAVKITNVADFKAFMKELVEGTTAVLNNSYSIRTEGDVAFDGMTIYLAADLDLNEDWTNDFNLKWNSTGKLTGKTTVTAPANKFNPGGQRIFGGMFDGQDHTISGLFIDKKKNAAAQSFFGVAHANSDFTVGVQNLTVKNSYIEGTNPGMGAFFTGVTAGTNVVISNCSVDVDLVNRYAGKDASGAYVGGLVGAAAGNVTVDSTTYSGSIWVDHTDGLRSYYGGGAIGGVIGGAEASAETNVMLNDFTFIGKLYWPNGQRIGLYIGSIQNQTTVSMVDSISKAKFLVLEGKNAGGPCNYIISSKEGVKTNVLIDNCYYVPGQVSSEGVITEQSLIFNAAHSGAASKPYGGFGKVSNTKSSKGICTIYIISDRGTDWSENLCLYLTVPSPDTGDMAGMHLGFVIAMMLFSAMALVILLPKKFCKK